MPASCSWIADGQVGARLARRSWCAARPSGRWRARGPWRAARASSARSVRPGSMKQHRHDEGEREEHGVPDLDRELAHAHAEHLDVADDARHQVADRRRVQVRHRPGQHAAERVGADVRADPGVGRHQPPAFADAGHLGQQRAADERQRGPADVGGRGLRRAPSASARSIARPSRIAGRTTAVFMTMPASDPSTSWPGHLPEVRPHLPEKREHVAALRHQGRSAGSRGVAVTRATMTSRARLKSSLTAGTSSQRSIRECARRQVAEVAAERRRRPPRPRRRPA